MLDTAVSRAILERVAAGELPDTLRIARPGAMVAFARQDTGAAGYAAAVRAARGEGFEAVVRQAGGRAAVFHEGTVSFQHATREADPRSGIYPRFEASSEVLAEALRRLGVDARVGEVPREYCPGGYSVNARGRVKLAGIGQRVIAGGAHVGAVIVAEDAERVRRPLVPVYAAMGLEFDPGTAGSVAGEVAGASVAAVIEAIVAEYGRRYELVEVPLDEGTLARAREVAAEHRAPDAEPATAG